MREKVLGLVIAILNINELNNYLEKNNMNGDSVSKEVSVITNFINNLEKWLSLISNKASFREI
jgi:hypothetical protein